MRAGEEAPADYSAALHGSEVGLITGSSIVVGLFALRALAPAALPWSDPVWNWLAMLSKTLLLGLGAGFALRAVWRFRDGGQIPQAWLFLGLGTASFLVGQLMLGRQLLRGIDLPFPSPAEVFFLAAYPFLIASQFAFVRALRQSGWPVGEPSENRRRMLLVAGFSLMLVLPALQPIALSGGPLLDRAINVAYPLLDIVLLAPAVIVLRVAFGLRGGRAQRVWLALILGVAGLAFGDVLFAYLTSLSFASLDPVVDLLYVLAYGAFALAPLSQLALAGPKGGARVMHAGL